MDVVLQAHNHNYQRTYPINYNKYESFHPLVTDTNSRYYEDPNGQIYVTVGTGGAALHSLNGKASYVDAQYMDFGFVVISITGNGRNLTSTFYANPDDVIKDSFTLIK